MSLKCPECAGQSHQWSPPSTTVVQIAGDATAENLTETYEHHQGPNSTKAKTCKSIQPGEGTAEDKSDGPGRAEEVQSLVQRVEAGAHCVQT